MKKYFIDYYAVIMMMLFVIYNLILENLKIGGLLYQVFMFILIIVNIMMLVVFRKKIKYKSLVIVIYFFTWLYSKNLWQCLFVFFNIIFLSITGFMENNFIKIVSISTVILIILFFYPILFAFLLVFGTNINEEKGMNDIYAHTHYYCNNNYEVYSYSAGVMDILHYSIGKYYNILNIDDIIYISYNERNEKTKEEYEIYLENNNCKLVGDKNGFK